MQTWPEVGDGVSGRGAQSMVRFGSGYFGQGRRGGGAGDEEVLPPGGGEENGVHLALASWRYEPGTPHRRDDPRGCRYSGQPLVSLRRRRTGVKIGGWYR